MVSLHHRQFGPWQFPGASSAWCGCWYVPFCIEWVANFCSLFMFVGVFVCRELIFEVALCAFCCDMSCYRVMLGVVHIFRVGWWKSGSLTHYTFCFHKCIINISDMVLNFKGPWQLYEYLPLVRYIYGNGICPGRVVPRIQSLVFFYEIISKFMAFKLHLH